MSLAKRKIKQPVRRKPSFEVVLVEPEIPFNTGNVGRTCLGFGARLHLLGKLGFSLEDRYLKRAGLDYWPSVDVKVYPDVDPFFKERNPKDLFFFSRHARRSVWDAKIHPGACLVFGCETRGLPPRFKARYPSRFFRIPSTVSIRSFNLSTSAGIVLAEACRQAAAPRNKKFK